MPGRAFPVAKKITVCQKDFTQKKDSVTIKKTTAQTKMSTEIRGNDSGGMWKSGRIYKNGGEKDVQSEQGIEQ